MLGWTIKRVQKQRSVEMRPYGLGNLSVAAFLLYPPAVVVVVAAAAAAAAAPDGLGSAGSVAAVVAVGLMHYENSIFFSSMPKPSIMHTLNQSTFRRRMILPATSSTLSHCIWLFHSICAFLSLLTASVSPLPIVGRIRPDVLWMIPIGATRPAVASTVLKTSWPILPIATIRPPVLGRS